MKRKGMRRIVGIGIFLFSVLHLSAQEENTVNPLEALEKRLEGVEGSLKPWKNLQIGGYMHAQYQWGQKDASMKIGAPNEDPESSFDRIGLRRSRVKISYNNKQIGGVFQLDLSDKGIVIRDASFEYRFSRLGTSLLRTGIFNRPFGDEIGFSSQRRESPERSTVTQTLFPEERDLGAMLVFQAAKSSPWNIVKLEAGLFAGNGVQKEIDSKRDFIGHLTVKKDISSYFRFGTGVSYYKGSVFQGTNQVYTMSGDSFIRNSDSSNFKAYSNREYYGMDVQFSYISPVGRTQLRAEYLFGEQPGIQGDSKSPNAATLRNVDTYIRNFQAGYLIFIQDMGRTPFQTVIKYDWYDPNTNVSGAQVGLNGTGKADAQQSTLGVGGIWNINKSMRMWAFYEFVSGEKGTSIASFDQLKKDVFTLRLQYSY